MEEIIRLVRLIELRKSKSSLFINLNDDTNFESKLYKLIDQQLISNDDEAMTALYGDSESSAKFRVLKSRMRKKLLNQLYLLDFPADKFVQSNIINCKIDAALLEVQILITANEYRIANKQLTFAITLAKNHGMTRSTVRALELQQSINTALGDRGSFQQCDTLLQSYYSLEIAERKAISLYQNTILNLQVGGETKNKYFSEVPVILQQLNSLWEINKLPRVFSLYHFLSIYYLELLGDYTAIDKVIEKAEKLLENGVVPLTWFDQKYNAFIRIYALLRTKQFKLGLDLSEIYLNLFDPDTVNWFAFMENYLLLALHSKQYQAAGNLFMQILNNPFIKQIQEPAKERWELYRRYLVLMGEVQPEQLKVDLPKRVFRPLVKLSHDKAGYNLSLLVLDITQSFSSTSIDSYEPQMQRLKHYIKKHLRGDKAERPRYFLRLLQLPIKKELSCRHTKAAGANLFTKLSQTPPPGDAFAEVEIIPYEHLWEVVLRVLELREKKLKGKKR
ncbi:hypothetical protein ACXYMU_09290 [Pontibacter sp. CAU 1760]